MSKALLPFIYGTLLFSFVSSVKYQHISDCEIVVVDNNFPYYNVTFVCGETDNENIIFERPGHIRCLVDYYYDDARVTSISFENCRFERINNSFFEPFGNLHVLNISYLELQSIDFDLSSVTNLIASNNNLSEFPSQLFVDPAQLQHLDLANNAIARIDSSHFDLATNLTTLNLSDNLLVEIPTHLFANTTKLTHADFSNNSIHQVHPNSFADAVRLISLDLSWNELKEFDGIAPPNLLTLDLSYNSLKNFTSTSGGLPKLKILNLSFNNFNFELYRGTFAHLMNLEHLNLKNTSISGIELGAFSFQSKLISLDLSENNLPTLDFGLFLPILRDLQSLNLAGNQIRRLDGFDNALFPQLNLLDLRNNLFDCAYLKIFMKSVNWENINFPLNPNEIDLWKPNIRGVNCDDDEKIYSVQLNSVEHY